MNLEKQASISPMSRKPYCFDLEMAEVMATLRTELNVIYDKFAMTSLHMIHCCQVIYFSRLLKINKFFGI